MQNLIDYLMLFIIKRDVFTQNLSNAMGLVNPVDTADLKHQGICSHIVIRKRKDYVYSIWVYKVLGMWKGYYRVKQERRLKHRNTLGGLEINIQHKE